VPIDIDYLRLLPTRGSSEIEKVIVLWDRAENGRDIQRKEAKKRSYAKTFGNYVQMRTSFQKCKASGKIKSLHFFAS